MLRRAIFILISVFCIQFISSCCEDLEFYDFDDMFIELPSNQIGAADSAFFRLIATEVDFMASVVDFGFNGAYATSCEYGWGGMKFPFTEIVITSDADFNDSLTAGSNLIDLFLYERFEGNGRWAWVMPADEEEIAFNSARFAIMEKPTASDVHRFRFELTKSNGDVITVESEAVEWL